MKREDVIRLFPEEIRTILRQADWNPEELQEIRLRAGKPLLLRQQGKEYFLSRRGMLTRHKELAYLVSQEQIRTTMEYLVFPPGEGMSRSGAALCDSRKIGVSYVDYFSSALWQNHSVERYGPADFGWNRRFCGMHRGGGG